MCPAEMGHHLKTAEHALEDMVAVRCPLPWRCLQKQLSTTIQNDVCERERAYTRSMFYLHSIGGMHCSVYNIHNAWAPNRPNIYDDQIMS